MPRMRPKWLLAALALTLGLALPPAALAEQARSAPPKVTAAEARYDTDRQTEQLRKEIEALPPQRPGVTDIYAIGIAGWSLRMCATSSAGSNTRMVT